MTPAVVDDKQLDLATTIQDDFIDRFALDAAKVIEELDNDALKTEISTVSIEGRISLLDRLSPAKSIMLFEALPREEQAQLVARAPTHLVLSLMASMSVPHRDEVLGYLSDSVRRELDRLFDLPAGAAGRLMDRDTCTLTRGMTVSQAVEKIRSTNPEGRRWLYLLDPDRGLDGRVEMQSLVLADATDKVSQFATPTVSVDALTPREEIVDLIDRHLTDSLPVVDSENRLLGLVLYDQLIGAVSESVSVDMQTMVGVSADEQALSKPVFSVVRRLPWLQINLFTAFLASAVVAMFEGLIAQFTALAVLLPVVAGQGGNAGAQALSVAVRGLALREISTRDTKRLFTKELAVGMVNGVALAVVCGIGVYLWSSSLGLTLVIALAMLMAIPIAGVAGALVPIFLTKLGADPATASSIVLTTVTDIAGFLSFLGIALALSPLL